MCQQIKWNANNKKRGRQLSKYDNWTLAKLKAEKSKLLKKYNEYHEITTAINNMVNMGELWNHVSSTDISCNMLQYNTTSPIWGASSSIGDIYGSTT